MKIKPIRMVMIGAGFMGRAHLQSVAGFKSVKYEGVVDVNGRLAGKLAREFGLDCFADIEQALEKVKPDAVDICVPTPFHRPLVEICACRGVHVLCEKPLALTVKDAEAMKKIADKNGIRLMVAQVLRFWPEYVFALTTARKGTFGRVKSLECRRLSPSPDWNSRMIKPGIGGGAVLDLQIHDMDFALQLLGKPASLQADGVKYAGAFNAVVNRLGYRNGATALIRASWLMPSSYPFRMTFTVEFEKAVVDMDSWRSRGRQVQVYPQTGKMQVPKLKQIDPYGAEIDYFARQLRSGKPFDRVPLSESIDALKLCLASQKACTGRSGI